MKLENPKIIDKLYHYVYKIVNVLNDKFYIGIHSTNNLDDGYFGSGIQINRSIKAHGKENHRKEILFFFTNRLQASEKEAELVTEETLKNPLCMNLLIGGSHNNKVRQNYTHSQETKKKISIANSGRKQSAEHIEKSRLKRVGRKCTPEHIAKVVAKTKGRKRSPETCERIRIAKSKYRATPQTIEKLKKYKGENHHGSIPITINDVKYVSILDASNKLNISNTFLHRKIKTEIKNKNLNSATVIMKKIKYTIIL